MKIAVLLFNDFETLDAFGPVELFGRLTDLYAIGFYSLHGGLVKNKHGVAIATEALDRLPQDLEIFIIPGGIGTRSEVANPALLEKIKSISQQSRYVLTVCTGAALLAKTGLLDNRSATSNKRVFGWVSSNGERVNWDERARWVCDGKFYTSSGVSAGMDMALGFLSDRHGLEFARKVAQDIEYHWREERDQDSFKIES